MVCEVSVALALRGTTLGPGGRVPRVRPRGTAEALDLRRPPGHPQGASLRSPEWQYIEYYEEDGQTVQYAEYYDLRSDPWEISNLLADSDPGNDPDVAALSEQLHRLWTCAGTTGDNPCI